jgi:hypothetical protein
MTQNLLRGAWIACYAAPYGHIATIPAGMPVIPATNLPEANRYWAEPWDNMTPAQESWERNYGFLLSQEEVG